MAEINLTILAFSTEKAYNIDCRMLNNDDEINHQINDVRITVDF